MNTLLTTWNCKRKNKLAFFGSSIIIIIIIILVCIGIKEKRKTRKFLTKHETCAHLDGTSEFAENGARPNEDGYPQKIVSAHFCVRSPSESHVLVPKFFLLLHGHFLSQEQLTIRLRVLRLFRLLLLRLLWSVCSPP